MRELRIKVDIVVPLLGDVLDRASRTIKLNAEVERLRELVGDGFMSVDVKEVQARIRVRAPTPDLEPTPIERAAAAQGSDEERAEGHPIMGDADRGVARTAVVNVTGVTVLGNGAEDPLAIPSYLDRRVPRPAPGADG